MKKTYNRPIYWHLPCHDFKADMKLLFAKTAKAISATINQEQPEARTLHKIVPTIVNSKETIKAITRQAHKDVTAVASFLDKALTKMFSSPYTKVVLQATAMLLICGGLSVLTTYGQSPITGGDDLVGTLKSIGGGIYDELRGPICGLGLVLAAVKFFSSDTNSRKQAGFIVAGVFIFALVPPLLEYIGKITKSGSLSFK